MAKMLFSACLILFLSVVGNTGMGAVSSLTHYAPIKIINKSGYDISLWLAGDKYRLYSGESIVFRVDQEYNDVYFCNFNGQWQKFSAKLCAGQTYKLVLQGRSFEFTGGWLY